METDPDISLPEGVFASEAAVEIRYSAPEAFTGRLNELLEAVRPFYARAQIMEEDGANLAVLAAGDDEPESFVTPEAAFFLQPPHEPLGAFTERAWSTWACVTRIFDLVEIERVGVRSAFLIGYDTVEAAVGSFRSHLVDYYDGPFADLGKPVEVATTLRFDAWKLWNQEIPLSINLRVTPIHILPAMMELLGEEKYRGALLMDIERYAFEPLRSGDVAGIGSFALTAVIETVAELGKRLRGPVEEDGTHDVA